MRTNIRTGIYACLRQRLLRYDHYKLSVHQSVPGPMINRSKSIRVVSQVILFAAVIFSRVCIGIFGFAQAFPVVAQEAEGGGEREGGEPSGGQTGGGELSGGQTGGGEPSGGQTGGGEPSGGQTGGGEPSGGQTGGGEPSGGQTGGGEPSGGQTGGGEPSGGQTGGGEPSGGQTGGSEPSGGQTGGGEPSGGQTGGGEPSGGQTGGGEPSGGIKIGNLAEPGGISSDAKQANIDGHVVDALSGYHFDHDGYRTILVPDGYHTGTDKNGNSTVVKDIPPQNNGRHQNQPSPPTPEQPTPERPTPELPIPERPIPERHISPSLPGDQGANHGAPPNTPPHEGSVVKPPSTQPGAQPNPNHDSLSPGRSQSSSSSDKTQTGGHVSTQVQSVEAAKAVVSKNKGSHCGQNGQCASLCKALVHGIGATSTWKRGAMVKGNSKIPIGTAIATFNFYNKGTNGYGPSSSPGGESGKSHTGVYLGQTSQGLMILHQFETSGGPRIDVIPWKNWHGSPYEAGNKYYIIK